MAAVAVEPKAEGKVLEGCCFIDGDNELTILAPPTVSICVLKLLLELAPAIGVTDIGFEKPEQGDATRSGVGHRICFVFKLSDAGKLVGTGTVTLKGISDLEAFKVLFELDPSLTNAMIASA